MTSVGSAYKIEALVELLLSNQFTMNDSPAFHAIKGLASFFPVRHKLPNYMKNVTGFFSPAEFRELVRYDETRFPSPQFPNKMLTTAGEQILQEYTSGANWSCSRVNLSLAIDVLKEDWAIYAKKLKAVIGWQTPKFSGITYRGALHSPIELFVMCMKRVFYIPSFVSSSTQKAFWKPFEDKYLGMPGNFQNILFEIDSREYPNFTTLIQQNQSAYQEWESLISCYNVYRWMGFRIRPEDGAMVVRLKIENYDEQQDGTRIKGKIRKISSDWLNTRVKGSCAIERQMPPERLALWFDKLLTSFETKFGELPWARWGGSDANFNKMTTPDSKIDWEAYSEDTDANFEEEQVWETAADIEGKVLDNAAFMKVLEQQKRPTFK